MPLTDPFPVDQNRIIKALEERIAALESQVRARPGAPVLKASGPFNIPTASSPATPASGASLYFADGFRYIDSAGNDKPVGASPAADVGGMAGLTTPNSWPGTYNPATGGLVQDDLEMIRTWVLLMRTVLRAANLMA